MRRWQLLVARCEEPVESPLYPPAAEVSEEESVHVVMLKGAPEAVLERCSDFLSDEGCSEIGPVFQKDCVVSWEDDNSVFFKVSLENSREIREIFSSPCKESC